MNPKTIFSGRAVRSILWPADRVVMLRALGRAVFPKGAASVELPKNLHATYQWLCEAQDATPDGGVSGCYNLGSGWGASYPETTGYIIPTFLHYGEAFHVPDAHDRAIRMADWETDVQLPDGAVRSGMLDVKVGPAVFNTGQVLFGWVAAYAATRDERYARSASKASEWLLSVQSQDGAWRKHLSVLTSSSVQTYNVRAAWGLAMAGLEFNEPRWMEAAIRNADWALAQQLENGWFMRNAFSEREDPLLHTIGYVLEGLLGIGELAGKQRYVDSVIEGVKPLMDIYDKGGILRGRYDARWKPGVPWRCLTGEAQVAVVLLRLNRVTSESRYATVAESLLRGLARLQDLSGAHKASYGAVSGSEPIWGGYGPCNYLNWAAKFFIDALLLHVRGVDVQRSKEPGCVQSETSLA
jgi:hypothetical protein